MEWITSNYESIIDIVAKIIACAAAIAAITPSRVDNDIVNRVLSLVNLLGLNVLKAKSADDQ
jgi:hypothetical protein